MKRILVPLVLALALALPVQAAAGTRHYTGIVDPSGTVDFNLEKKRKKGKGKIKKVKDFTFGQIPITCSGGAATAGGRVDFGMTVERNRFSGRGIFEASNLRVKGEVNRRGSTGTIRLFGEVPLEDGNVGQDCRTGKLPWSADRS